MEYFQLNNGVRVPAVGSGTNTFGRDNGDLKSPPTGNYTAMESAIQAGYRFFDSAISYGNEEGIGACLINSGIDRSELTILSKIPNRAPYNCTPESIRRSVEDSLKRMKMDYFDLYTIHQAVDYNSADGRMNEAVTIALYKELEKLYREGKFKALGVANFDREQLEILMAGTDIVPACNQIRSNPANRNMATVEFCRSKGILPIAHSPMNFTVKAFQVDQEAAERFKKSAAGIGEKYGKSWAQVLLRYNYQLGICSIPKSHSVTSQRQNLDIFDFSLSAEEMEQLF